jgi:hypothetical protein
MLKVASAKWKVLIAKKILANVLWMKRADAWKVANTNVIAKNLAKKAVVKSVQHITNFR